MTSQPFFVTTACSSILAADQPSLEGQSRSSAVSCLRYITATTIGAWANDMLPI